MSVLTEFLRQLPRVYVTSHVESRTFPPKEGEKHGRTIYDQIAYLCAVDEFGQETRSRIKVGLGDDPSKRYLEGDYTFTGSSLRVGKYGDPELSRYDLSLVRLVDEAELSGKPRAVSSAA